MSRNNPNTSRAYLAVTERGAVQRIRAPSRTDVLLGRGGGINGHIGNQVFREWVRERKEDYNLAGSKVEKTRVATEVMDRVKAQNPPGRFLQRESGTTGMGSSSAWWVEVDTARALAKTSQALREGAPKIRAAHQSELQAAKSKAMLLRKRKAPTTDISPVASQNMPQPTSWPQTVPISPAEEEQSRGIGEDVTTSQPPLVTRPLMSNQEFQSKYQGTPEEPSSKRYRTSGIRAPKVEQPRTTAVVDVHADTPPLMSTSPALRGKVLPMPPLQLDTSAPTSMPKPNKRVNLPRTHSLAFSDMSTPIEGDEDFVNPFLDESEIFYLYGNENGGTENHKPKTPSNNSSNNSSNKMLRNVSSEDGREDYRSMAELYDFPTTNNGSSSPATMSTPPTTSASNSNNHRHDFNEDMKHIWDAVQTDGDITSPRDGKGEGMPTLFIPWRGGILKRRYGTKENKSNVQQVQ